jgi:hypothetical protein
VPHPITPFHVAHIVPLSPPRVQLTARILATPQQSRSWLMAPLSWAVPAWSRQVRPPQRESSESHVYQRTCVLLLLLCGVQDSAATLQVALTIAIRWAVARRQGEPITSVEQQKLPAPPSPAATGALPHPTAEPQLLDYVTHQAKLMPLLATAYAFVFTAHRMKARYAEHYFFGACMVAVFVISLPRSHALPVCVSRRSCTRASCPDLTAETWTPSPMCTQRPRASRPSARGRHITALTRAGR